MAPSPRSSVRPIRRVVSVLAEVIAEGPELITYEKALGSAATVYSIMAPLLQSRPTEEFWAVLLDVRHHVIGASQVSVGSLTASIVHPREVFGPAVRMGASSIIVVHNHPSGDAEPSTEDVAVTKRLAEAGKLLGIPLLDHVVCGEHAFVSLRERAIVS